MKKYDLENLPFGYINPNEAKILASYASTIPENGVIVEVGSFLGRSAVILARHAKPTVKIFCIDTFDENHMVTTDTMGLSYRPEVNSVLNLHKEFIKNTAMYKNIIPLKGYSPYDIEYPNYEIDMFFLDAGHINPNDKDNLDFFFPLVKYNGIICGHDYYNEFPDVIENVLMLEKTYNLQKIIFPKGTLWAMRKK